MNENTVFTHRIGNHTVSESHADKFLTGDFRVFCLEPEFTLSRALSVLYNINYCQKRLNGINTFSSDRASIVLIFLSDFFWRQSEVFYCSGWQILKAEEKSQGQTTCKNLATYQQNYSCLFRIFEMINTDKML